MAIMALMYCIMAIMACLVLQEGYPISAHLVLLGLILRGLAAKESEIGY